MFFAMLLKPFVGLVLFGLALFIARRVIGLFPAWLRPLLLRRLGADKGRRRPPEQHL